jgi:hypothetical protein
MRYTDLGGGVFDLARVDGKRLGQVHFTGTGWATDPDTGQHRSRYDAGMALLRLDTEPAAPVAEPTTQRRRRRAVSEMPDTPESPETPDTPETSESPE